MSGGPTVFVSAPSVLTEHQELLRRRWTAALATSGLTLDRLDRLHYGERPWDLLLSRLARADAVLVLGFRQLHVHDGVWRPGTTHEAPASGSAATSPWLHVEIGIAAGLRLPTLVAAEDGVREGAFGDDVPAAWLFRTSLDAGPHTPEVIAWQRSLDRRGAATG